MQNTCKIGEYSSINVDILPDEIDEFEVFRDDSYYLLGKIKGSFKDSSELETLYLDGEAGQFIEPLNFEFTEDIADIDYKIKGIYGNLNSGYGRKGNYFKYDFSMNSIYRDYKTSSNVDWIMEWFLNGPRSYIYPESTEYKLIKTCKKERNYLKSEFKSETGGFSRDFLQVECKANDGNDIHFVIHSVPDVYPPKWSKKVGIEYREEWGIPRVEEREKITEIIGFLFGRQLIKIGCTKFVEDGWPAEDIAYNPEMPSDINLIEICKREDYPPVNIDPLRNRLVSMNYAANLFENINLFNKLIPKYLELRDDLNLDEVLWRYWLSETSPSYVRLIVLAGSFELLVNSWYGSNNSKLKGNFLTHDEFITIFKDELESINKKLDDIKWEMDDFAERFYNKIVSSNQMGFNASIHFFFKEIGLDIGKIEKLALEYRNKPAHGYIISSEDTKNFIKCEHAYKTLVNRVLLKILNFDGAYIDYYTINYPLRGINEPLGENIDFIQTGINIR